MLPSEFTIRVSTAELRDLRTRVRRTRWPDDAVVAPWVSGPDFPFLRGLAERWSGPFDWRIHERRLNQLSHFRVEVDGLPLHYVLQPGRGPRPVPLLLIHGAFSNFFEFHKVLGPLSDPVSFGGDPEDSFDVVLLSLPGFAFSNPVQSAGVDLVRVADLAHRLMTDVLHYDRYGVGGGSWGGLVASRIAAVHPESLVGLHLTQASPPARAPGPGEEATPAERGYSQRLKEYVQSEIGYQKLLSTRPDAVAVALNDSPVGLAAWFTDRLRAWTDWEDEPFDREYTIDDLLIMLSITWFTGSVAASQRLYFEDSQGRTPFLRDLRIEVPTGVLGLPSGMPNETAPPEMISRTFNLIRYRMADRGGHFPALDSPETLVEELRTFFGLLRNQHQS